MRKLIVTAALAPVAIGVWVAFSAPLLFLEIKQALEGAGCDFLNMELDDE